MLSARTLSALTFLFVLAIAPFGFTSSLHGQTDSGAPKKAAKKKAAQKTKSNEKSNEKGPAYIVAPKDDKNFPLMGEFTGKVSGEGSSESQLGLQIRAIGDNRFEAIAYRGGLPGQPNFNPEPTHMIGQRSSDFVILSGGPWAVIVEKNTCRVIDRSGKQIGNLKRIRRGSPTLLAPAPEGATILFDGTNTDHFTKAEISKDGLLMQGADLKPMFQDYNLHIEFRLPYMPLADSQQRGNSGLYLQSRYECQILDSFATVPVFNGLGALYRFRTPDFNMALPPLTWQTYDVQFTAPRWAADGSKISNAKITSWVNGVKVQDNVSLPNKTGAGKVEEPILLPIRFQDHGDPVRFRNAWLVDRGLVSSEFPIRSTKEQRKSANKAMQLQKQKRMKAERKKRAEEAKIAAALKIAEQATAKENEESKKGVEKSSGGH